VFSMDQLNDFIHSNNVKIGIIAVPEMAAQHVADVMVTAGIKGILNFAPLRLRLPEDIVINNVNLASELENVIYYVTIMEKDKSRKAGRDQKEIGNGQST